MRTARRVDPVVLRHGLIVSCQAHGDHPLREPHIISALAACAKRGGATAIRADRDFDELAGEGIERLDPTDIEVWRQGVERGRARVPPESTFIGACGGQCGWEWLGAVHALPHPQGE